jgi:hypothetical protein
LCLRRRLLAARLARQAQPSPKPETASSPQDAPPVSLDKIKAALQQAPPDSLRGLDVKPTFKIEAGAPERFRWMIF